MPVAQLKLGMHILQADGHYGVITGWKIVPGSAVMYNLDVAHDHTFTVGMGEWVVHNLNAPCGGGDPSLDGLGKLKNQVISVTQKGIDLVKQHLSQFLQDDGSMYPQNTSAINRLQQAYDAGNGIAGGDASFYMHELYEKTLMDQELSYEEAHSAALARYEVSPFSVYSPEVIQDNPSWFATGWFKFWSLPSP